MPQTANTLTSLSIPESIAARAGRAAAIAARHAGDVDAQGRFPPEAMDAL